MHLQFLNPTLAKEGFSDGDESDASWKTDGYFSDQGIQRKLRKLEKKEAERDAAGQDDSDED